MDRRRSLRSRERRRTLGQNLHSGQWSPSSPTGPFLSKRQPTRKTDTMLHYSLSKVPEVKCRRGEGTRKRKRANGKWRKISNREPSTISSPPLRLASIHSQLPCNLSRRPRGSQTLAHLVDMQQADGTPSSSGSGRRTSAGAVNSTPFSGGSFVGGQDFETLAARLSDPKLG